MPLAEAAGVEAVEKEITADEIGAESVIHLPYEKQLEMLKDMEADILDVCSTVRRRPIYSFAKRLFDIVASFLAIIFLSPLLLIVSHKIKKDSEGPAVFKQQRVGKNGKVFTMYKFRSMYMDAEERLESILNLNSSKNTLMFKAKNDPRITPFGKKIRECSIDELPQLFNILKGEMSFVGPRPPLVREVIQYEKEYTIRLAVKGGLTCFWQISGRNDADFDFCIEQDKRYLKERSFWTDIKLIFITAARIFAYKGE